MISSLILTKHEWGSALRGEGEMEGLCDKGLATRDESGTATLSREMQLIVDEYYQASAEEITPEITALRGGRFCMLVEPYPLMKEALKITLLRDGEALDEEFEERRRLDSGDGCEQ